MADSLRPGVLLIFALLLDNGGAVMTSQKKALSFFFWFQVSFNVDFCPPSVRGFSLEFPASSHRDIIVLFSSCDGAPARC